jgi:hypothetical protein
MREGVDAPVYVQSQDVTEDVEVHDCNEFITPKSAQPDWADESEHDRCEHVDSMGNQKC